MRTSKPTVAPPALVSTPNVAQDAQYFPDLSLGDTRQLHDFVVNWYTGQLKALREPSMLQLSKARAHAYRFLWLRTFDNPVAVRLDVGEDGTSLLTVKVTDGMSGYWPGVLVKDETRKLDGQRTEWFLDQVERVKFWTLPTSDDRRGCDGAEWVLEAAKDGRYKLVVRWSPETGPVRDLGLVMLTKLAELQCPKDATY